MVAVEAEAYDALFDGVDGDAVPMAEGLVDIPRNAPLCAPCGVEKSHQRQGVFAKAIIGRRISRWYMYGKLSKEAANYSDGDNDMDQMPLHRGGNHAYSCRKIVVFSARVCI